MSDAYSLALIKNEESKIDTENVEGEENNLDTEYELAPCCQPIPGDEVVGCRLRTGKIVIHQQNCPQALDFKAKAGKQLLTAEWNMHRYLTFPVSIEIKGIDKMGIVIRVLDIISEKHKVNVTEMTFTADTGIFDGKMLLRVHDDAELKELLTEIQTIKEVNSISRTNQ